jgi:hypothetical protein
MNRVFSAYRNTRLTADRAFFLVALSALSASAACAQSAPSPVFTPGNLVVSRSVYYGNSGTVTVGQPLPGGGTAVANGTYPYVFNNESQDGSFGVTSPFLIDQMSLTGAILNTIEVPNNLTGATGSQDHLVTSFPSKSEQGLHLSTDGKYVTFIDYVAQANALDISNSNTPAANDSTNPVTNSIATYRAVGIVDASGNFSFTETNAYSGNNGRAAIYVDTPVTDGTTTSGPNNFFLTVGNAGNGSNPEPKQVVEGAGLQLIVPVTAAEASQTPGNPTPVGSFNVSQVLPVSASNPDKVGKDDNFRGITVYNGVVYVTKGSGGNGINTVYFLDTTGTACPRSSATPGVGLPVPNAPFPTPATALALQASYTSATGLANNMCVLAGFPTIVNKTAPASAQLMYPFGLWFANPTTLYVADEGDGKNTYSSAQNLYTDAAGQTTPANTGGLQKWIFNATTKTWQLAYTLKNGLNLGVPYSVPTPTSGPYSGIAYPVGLNSATGLPWAPSTDGLRQLTGVVGGNRFTGPEAVIYAVSSTVSGGTDTGADPNKIYVITDKINNTSAAVAAQEQFTEFRDAVSAEVLRGISFTPGTAVTSY